MRKWKRTVLAAVLAALFSILAAGTDGICAAAAEPETDGAEELSLIEESLASQYDFNEIDGSLKELFPEEQLEFKDTLIGILSGDLDFSLRLDRKSVV